MATFTGAFAQVARISGGATGIGDLEWNGSKLLTLGWTSIPTVRLYELNRTSGRLDRIGTGELIVSGDWISDALGWDGTNLYAGSGRGDLYRINPTTGVPTRIGAMGARMAAFAWDGSKMFGVSTNPNALFEINLTTGRATRIGSATRFGQSSVSFFPGGLEWDGENLVMGGANPSTLLTVDKTTGVGTVIANTNSFFSGLGWDGSAMFAITNNSVVNTLTQAAATRAPDTPDNVLLSTVDRDTLRLTFDASSGATYYEYKIAVSVVDLGAASWTRTTVRTVDIDMLQPGTTYYATVRAGNPAGTSTASVAASGTTQSTTPVAAPTTPGSFTLIAQTSNILRASWQASTGTVTQYEIKVATSEAGLDTATWQNAGTGTHFDIRSLQASTRYYAQLRAVGPGGNSAATSVVRGTTPASVDISFENAIFERVGNANKFGVNEDSPIGLIDISGTLYMLSQSRIYRLSKTGGTATRIGSDDNFGITVAPGGEVLGLGIAAINNTVYVMLGIRLTRGGDINYHLCTLNLTTGIATRVSRTPLNNNRTGGALASIGNTLYHLGEQRTGDSDTAVNRSLFTLNTNTGQETRVGSRIVGYQKSGMTSIGNFLYTHPGVGQLLKIDPSTGIPVHINTTGGNSFAGLAWDGKVLYGVTDHLGNDTLYRALPRCHAEFSDATGTGRTRTVRVTFNTEIDTNTFTTGDIAVSTIAGTAVTLTGLAQVNVGAADHEYDLTFNLPNNAAGVIQYDITGTVSANGRDCTVAITPGSFSYSTRPSVIAARFSRIPDGLVVGNFSVDVDFSPRDTADTITEFTTADIVITGDTDGLTDYTVTPIQGQPHIFRINFSPTVDTTGLVNIAVSGSVLVGTVRHGVSISPISVRYDTRAAIQAEWRDTGGIKTDEFSIRLLFSGSEPIETPDRSFFSLVHITGDSISELGISDFTIQPISNSNDFLLTFTPAEGATGVFEIDVVARVNVGASGSQVMRAVVIPHTRIIVGTGSTLPAFDPASIPSPQWEIVPEEITQANVDQNFDLNFGENIRGLTLGDIVEHGVQNRRITLYRIVGGREVIHSDDTPAALFRIKVQISANQQGNLTLTVRRGAVMAIDDGMRGPIADVLSPSVPYNTVPEEVQPATVEIGPPENPVGQVANQPFKGTELWHDITFSEDIASRNTLNLLAAAITLRDTSNAGPVNVLAANLENVGTGGTRTHFRLRVPMPDDASGVYWLEVRENFVNNNLPVASTPVWYDTEDAAGIPPSPVWENVPESITQANTDVSIDLNFGENITGLIGNDIVEDGVANRRITLYKVLNGVESLHTDDTPAALFRVKLQLSARQRGALTLTLKANSVSTSDDETVGPVEAVRTRAIYYDTYPETPAAVDPVQVTFGVLAKQTDATFDVNVGFSEQVTGIAKADFALSGDTEGIDFVVVGDDSASNSRALRFTITGEIEGSFSIQFTGGLLVGGVAREAESGYGYYTYDRKPDTPTPTAAATTVRVGLPERPVGQTAAQPIREAITFDITWSKDFEAFAANRHIGIYQSGQGATNPLAASLENVGTSGTFTHFRFTYTPPENARGTVVIGVLPNVFESNAEVRSVPVDFDTTAAVTPTPEIIDFEMPKGIINESGTIMAFIEFDREVSGVDTNAFELEGVSGASITAVDRVVDDMGDPITDDDGDVRYRYQISISVPEGIPLSLLTMNLVGGRIDVA